MPVDVSLHDVHQALRDLGKLRFGEMRVEDAISEVVRTTHTMFGVDGAGLMLVDDEQHLRKVAASMTGSGTWRTCRSATRRVPASTPSTVRN